MLANNEGGANGIGRAMTELLHKLGAVVVVCDRKDQDGLVLEKQLGSCVIPRTHELDHY